MSADAESNRAQSFTWFDAETVLELCAQLNAAGDGARLEVHKVGPKMWLHVIPADTARALAFTPLNKSWECPPVCP